MSFNTQLIPKCDSFDKLNLYSQIPIPLCFEPTLIVNTFSITLLAIGDIAKAFCCSRAYEEELYLLINDCLFLPFY
jgi:hypothetical protein